MNQPAQRPYAVSARPCGSARLRIGQARATLRASGALWLEDVRTLVVADLHFEKGSAFAARGQMLPPYDTRETLARVAAEARATEAKTVVFLGDSLHDRKAESRLAAEDVAALSGLAAGRTLIWIVGNHDADGPRGLPGEVADELSILSLTLRHEPSAGPQDGEVAGHLHPCARVRGKGGSVRRRCFITDGERLVMPAFGAYAGGLNVRDAAFEGLFRRAPLAVALGAGKAHPVAWPRLGPD